MGEVRIKQILEWTYPMYGNVHIMPYGKLLVTDGIDTEVCATKGDKYSDKVDYQYITFKRKRYKLITFYKGDVKCLKLEEVRR